MFETQSNCSSPRGTKLIFVMGQSGTGKTTLLRELTGHNQTVGCGMEPGIKQYQFRPATIDGEECLFVDTAGFGAADLDNMSNFHDIMSCLSVLGPFVTVAGVLFVYGPPPVRLTVLDVRTTRWIECFCGPEVFKNITIVTSQWDRYNEKAFEEAWERAQILEQSDDIAQILNPPDRYHGGYMYHHGLPGGQGSINSHRHALSRKRQGESEATSCET